MKNLLCFPQESALRPGLSGRSPARFPGALSTGPAGRHPLTSRQPSPRLPQRCGTSAKISLFRKRTPATMKLLRRTASCAETQGYSSVYGKRSQQKDIPAACHFVNFSIPLTRYVRRLNTRPSRMSRYFTRIAPRPKRPAKPKEMTRIMLVQPVMAWWLANMQSA